MREPTLYAKLMDVACDQPRRDLHAHFRQRAASDADAVAGLLAKAYAEGVRDGFAQGVAAAEAQEPHDA